MVNSNTTWFIISLFCWSLGSCVSDLHAPGVLSIANSVWPHNVHRPFPWTWNRALWNCSWITHCANNLIVQVPVSASSGYSSLPHPCLPLLILLLQIKKNPSKNLFASGSWMSLSHKPVLGFSTQSYQQLRDSSSSSSSLSIQARASSSSSLDLWYCNHLEVVWMGFVRSSLLLSQRVFLWNSTHCHHVLSCNCGWNQPLHFFTLPRMPFAMQRETHRKQTETERGREERFSRVDTGWRLLSRIGVLRIENKTLLIENSKRSGSHKPPSLPLSLRAVD